MQVQRQTGVTPSELLDAPGLPENCEQLWKDFLELHTSRGSGGFGPSRISFAEIDAFQRVTSTRLPAWQIAAIKRADDMFMMHAAEEAKSK